MFLKTRNKILRKYDSDFWNFLYNRRRKNKFFIYFRLSLINKLQNFYKKNYFYINKHNRLKINMRQVFNPFMNFYNLKNLNHFRFFGRSKFFVKRIFFKYIKPKKNKTDILFGIKSAFEHYKSKTKSIFYRLKIYIKKIILFYNNFNQRKLIKFANLTKKSKIGGINYFFFKLESRLDSILLRLNISNRFYIRKLIKSNLILVNNFKVNYLNFIIKKSDLITFQKSFKIKLYKILKKVIKYKRFFAQPPYYLEINYRTLTILLLPRLIDPAYIAYPFFNSKNQLITGLHTVLWGF
jgi:ribosomal protein S4